MSLPSADAANVRPIPLVPRLIFASRWLQLPLYVGLIVAQVVYVFHFWVELTHLIEAVFGNREALTQLVTSIGYKAAPEWVPALNETVIMLVVLGLIDVVMISNLLIMVIVGGYETFVSRMNLQGHPDQPEWLSHVNASVLKVKLAMAIIGISSIHLLKTFIEAGSLGSDLPLCGTLDAMVAVRDAAQFTAANVGMAVSKLCANATQTSVMWQTIIHTVFILSAIGIAYTDKLMTNVSVRREKEVHPH